MTNSSTAAVAAVATTGVRTRRKVLFLGLTALMYGLVLTGFWPYWRTAGIATPPRPWIIHVHAAVFTGWMVLLLAQVLLIQRRRVGLHRRLGTFGIYYGAAVVVMGLVAATVAPAVHVIRGEWSLDEAAAFLILPAGDMLLFSTLFGAAVLYRRRREVHKRCVLLATVALMFAPVGRLVGDRGPVPLLFGVWLAPVVVAMLADLRARRRVHPALLVGAAWLVLVSARVAWMNTPTWLHFGRAFVTAVTPTVARLF